MDRSGEAANSRRARRTPWGLLGMLGVVAAIEWTLAHHDLDFTYVWHWDWRVAGRAAERKAPGYDILCFGDSLMKFAVMPKVIKERTGKQAYNLAIHVGHLTSSYMLFRRTLESGARPTAVLLDATPHLMASNLESNARQWPELLTTRECLELARESRDVDFFTRTMLARLLPSYKERFEMRKNLFLTMQGHNASLRSVILAYRLNWKGNQGAQLMYDSPAPQFDADWWTNTVYPYFYCDPINDLYLRKFCDLALKHHIRVYWLLPPIHPEVMSRIELNGFEVAYTRFVRAVQASYPNLVVLDGRKSGLANDHFIFDGAHLNRRGALLISASIADVLKEAPAEPAREPRWVSLKVDPTRPVRSTLEDVNQSQVALDALGKKTIR